MLNIDNITFESNEMPDFWEKPLLQSHRLTASDLAAMPDDTKDLDRLKALLYDYMHLKLGNYAKLEAMCDIKADTFQKKIRYKNSRPIDYIFLAKFCIGAKLNEKEARELFLLMGHILDERNRYDYILLHELRREGTLEDYDADMIKYGDGSILSRAD